jgi:hypothetical protein
LSGTKFFHAELRELLVLNPAALGNLATIRSQIDCQRQRREM